jgi:hypothetical protein
VCVRVCMYVCALTAGSDRFVVCSYWDVFGNQLSGSIPSTLGNLTSVGYV